ncbi:MAG TPA: CoA pyrophosphatase [Bacteroidales bacterium]|nr:CoA pyrophosphatase [Bacteroidales bacterium]
MNDKLDFLKYRLLQPLPGKDAQYDMAPSYRIKLEEGNEKLLAGVTILLYERNNEFYFPLIVRPEYEGAHGGQISLPGGKMDPGDRNLVVTALRECEEEIGIEASKIIVLGNLTELFIPVSSFEVHPLIGYFEGIPQFIPQASEVVSIIEVPLELLLNEDTKEFKRVIFNSNEEIVPFFKIGNKMVWGATAMILNEFIQVWKESKTLYSETRFL